jgi:pimeloyl-ACP methyl ester carboxylesterase
MFSPIRMATSSTPSPESTPICVVMLHGAAHNHSVWQHLADGLERAGVAVMTPDLPGHGECPGPALADVPACADWVLALAESQGWRRLVLVGHSMGALIALEAAARAALHGAALQQQVLSLVLLGAAYPMKVSTALLSLALDDPAKAIHKVAQYSHARDAVAALEADQHLMQLEQHQYAAAGHGNLLHHDLSLCNDYTSGLQSAAQVRCASTLIAGREDRMTPLAASAELQSVLSAQRIDLATGHNLMAEDPAGVLAAVLAVCNALAAT